MCRPFVSEHPDLGSSTVDEKRDEPDYMSNLEIEVQGCEVRSGGEAVEGAGFSGYTLSRRGGRVVECGGLENRYVGNPGVGGSNPPLSAALCAAERASAFGFGISAGQHLLEQRILLNRV
jgi:hypothetical protein